MVEVFTVGGGEYIVNTFNAVAAWTGGGGYKSLIKVVLVIGLIYSLLAVAFSMNFRAWMNWFLGATMIYLCLMVPTVDVRVTDRVNPDLAPATVANVPLGLGVMASFTSQVGDYLTRTAETVFVMPSQLNYSTSGMIYGSRLFDATRNFQIRDAEFATNLQAHFKQCAFGDIMLHRKSLTDLANSQDLWTDIGPGSPARSQQWLERDGGVESSIVTCQQAYDMLTARWEPIIEIHAPIWGKEAYPRLTNALASQKLRQDVPIANAAFTNAATDFTGTMRQNTAINAFMQARDAMAGGSGAAAIDTFATTRADIQARNTYNSIAQQAMSWVPILNVVLTVVFYAMFPVIFPLFLMPQTGVQALKGYVTGFFYLASWGPLYVILHMICMSRGESASRGIADGGVTLATYAGIGAVNAETATIAGFMLMSVPFIAGGLARGALSVSSQATSILAPAQNAAEAAALEQTTGNYAYGNVSYANSTANMHQSNQYSDAPTMMTGKPSFTYRAENGALFTTTANGQSILDATAAMSKLPFTATDSTGYAAEQRVQASALTREASSLENSAAEIRTHVAGQRNARANTSEFTTGSEASIGAQSGTSLEQSDRNSATTFEGTDSTSGVRSNSNINESHRRGAMGSEVFSGGVNVGLGGGGGAPGKGGAGKGSAPSGGGPSMGLNAGKSWSTTQDDGVSRDVSRARSIENASTANDGTRNDHTFADNASISDGTYARNGSFSRASQTASSTQSEEQSLQLAESYERRARQMREEARQLSNDASWSESHNGQLSENLSQELYEWYRQASAKLPRGVEAPGLHETSLDASRREVRDGLVAQFFSERSQRVHDMIEGRLEEPGSTNLTRPSVASEADVVGRYRSLGSQFRPNLSAGGDQGDEIGARVARGKVAIEAKQAAVQSLRGGAVTAGSGLRQEVDTDLNRQFFTDPKQRE